MIEIGKIKMEVQVSRQVGERSKGSFIHSEETRICEETQRDQVLCEFRMQWSLSQQGSSSRSLEAWDRTIWRWDTRVYKEMSTFWDKQFRAPCVRSCCLWKGFPKASYCLNKKKWCKQSCYREQLSSDRRIISELKLVWDEFRVASSSESPKSIWS